MSLIESRGYQMFPVLDGHVTMRPKLRLTIMVAGTGKTTQAQERRRGRSRTIFWVPFDGPWLLGVRVAD